MSDSTATTTAKTPVGVKDIAAKVGTEPKHLRAFLRSQGVGVGSGKRYAWPSMGDPQVRAIVKAWKDAHAEPKGEA
jgi:phage antirepressor YoqD-like protein